MQRQFRLQPCRQRKWQLQWFIPILTLPPSKYIVWHVWIGAGKTTMIKDVWGDNNLMHAIAYFAWAGLILESISAATRGKDCNLGGTYWQIPASMYRSRQYAEKRCLMRSVITTFYTQTWSSLCVSRTAEVLVPMYLLFTVGSWYRYFCQEPVVLRTTPQLLMITKLISFSLTLKGKKGCVQLATQSIVKREKVRLYFPKIWIVAYHLCTSKRCWDLTLNSIRKQP